MNPRRLVFLCLFVFIIGNIHANIIDALEKRGRSNAISFNESWYILSLFTENGYLTTEVWSDGIQDASIVAYKIQENAINLIVRSKDWDAAYRIFDIYYNRERIDPIHVIVHNYYLVELVYADNKLETYCNRIMEINTNGYVFNTAKISNTVNTFPDGEGITYSDGFTLAEGTELQIVSLANELASITTVYEYKYNVEINDRQLSINGWFLDFDNKVNIRSYAVDYAPLPAFPEQAVDYLQTWRSISVSQVCTITITATEFHYHSTFGDGYEYKLSNLAWTEITRPDDAFFPYIGFETDNYKGAVGYIITGIAHYIHGNWRDRKIYRTEYVFLRPNDTAKMLWYNSGSTNRELIKVSGTK